MTQPLLGLLASAIAIVVSIGLLALVDFPTFVGWVSFYMLAVVPIQVVVVVIWGANLPAAADLRQPAKGAVLLLVTAIVAAVMTPLVWQFVGEGVSPPGPIPSQYAVVVVPTTFFLAIAFGGWPFTLVISNRIAAGLLLLAAAYLITWALFRAFFDYEFLKGAPVYLQSAPHGSFNGVVALVFYVTMLAAMFLLLHFDLWPLTTAPAVMKQPVLGVAWTLIAAVIAAVVMWVTLGRLALDPMYVLTRITAPFIFGTIIVLNMLQNSLFATLRQPFKGVANAVTAFVAGLALAQVYGVLAPALAGMPLSSGAPGYEYELWLVNALLSVTFPVLIFSAAYFTFWPLPQPAPAKLSGGGPSAERAVV
jgi:hypothetical protein